MKKKIARFILCNILGWKMGKETPPPEDKCIILGAAHTNISEYFVYLLYIHAMGDKMNVLVKKEFFRWPIRRIMKAMGCIPVDRSRTGGANLMKSILEEFDKRPRIHLAIAPEGTRKPVRHWKLGFHSIARHTGVPVYLGYFDWGRKIITYGERFICSEDGEADLRTIQRHYKRLGITAYHPDQFVFLKEIEDEQ